MDRLPGEERGDKEQTRWSSLTTQEGESHRNTGLGAEGVPEGVERDDL